MKKSVYDLTFEFIETFYGEIECPPSIKQDILHFMDDLLYDGFTSEEIIGRWEVFANYNPNKMPKLMALYKQNPSNRNLVKPGIFYFHNLLQCTTGVPVKDIDLNTGIITSIEEDYFLEMRASLSIDQLVDYYARQFNIRLTATERKREVGRFNWLLKNHDLESILFMIDVATNMAQDMDWGLIEPIKLGEFKLEAIGAKMAKITEIRQAGDEKIVPRKRVLSSRRRSQDAKRIHTQSNYAPA